MRKCHICKTAGNDGGSICQFCDQKEFHTCSKCANAYKVDMWNIHFIKTLFRNEPYKFERLHLLNNAHIQEYHTPVDLV